MSTTRDNAPGNGVPEKYSLEMHTSRPASKRFNPSMWSARLVPIIMVILALALLFSVVIVILSMLGLTPAF